jgi:hypothetical protein
VNLSTRENTFVSLVVDPWTGLALAVAFSFSFPLPVADAKALKMGVGFLGTRRRRCDCVIHGNGRASLVRQHLGRRVERGSGLVEMLPDVGVFTEVSQELETEEDILIPVRAFGMSLVLHALSVSGPGSTKPSGDLGVV